MTINSIKREDERSRSTRE